MYAFSEQTLACLSNAQWSEEYRFDTTEYERILKANGYIVFPAVRDFLHHFGGLHIVYPHLIVRGAMEYLETIVTESLASVFRFNVSSDSIYLRTPLCIIGEAYSGELLLMICDSERL